MVSSIFPDNGQPDDRRILAGSGAAEQNGKRAMRERAIVEVVARTDSPYQSFSGQRPHILLDLQRKQRDWYPKCVPEKTASQHQQFPLSHFAVIGCGE